MDTAEKHTDGGGYRLIVGQRILEMINWLWMRDHPLAMAVAGPPLLKALTEEESLLPYGMVIERAKYLETQLFVKPTGLKLIGVEPKPDAVVVSCNPLRALHESFSIAPSAMFLGDGKQFYEEPIVGAFAPMNEPAPRESRLG